jgi:large subunit ribosomal protein L28
MAAASKTFAKLFKRINFLPDSYRSFNGFPYFCRPKFFQVMARVCQVTGKTPIGGNKVSHSNIKTKRRFLPNLQTKRFFLAEENKWITLKLTTDAIRTINKRGLYNVVKELRAQGQHI